jgi:hypothetical protein
MMIIVLILPLGYQMIRESSDNLKPAHQTVL